MAHFFKRRSASQLLEKRAFSAPHGSDKRHSRDLALVANRREDFHDAEEVRCHQQCHPDRGV